MAQFNLPYHAHMPERDYRMADHYPDPRMTSPPELGGWMEQSDGGGKFQLKRRRRCGQCGPCQVKDNCNKCQYCLRKDVLKQACIHRKCVYLRKPASHHRPDLPPGNISSDAEKSKDGGRSSSCSSANQDSPHKPSPSTPSAVHNPNTKPVAVNPSSVHSSKPANPSAVAAAAAVVQSAELSSCQMTKPSFPASVNKEAGEALKTNSGTKCGTEPVRANGLPVNKGLGDPLRTSALEQHHTALLDAAGVLDPCRTSYMAGARGLEVGRGSGQVLGPGSNNADCGFPMGGGIAGTTACAVAKDLPLPQREQFRSPMDQWGPVPYGYSNPNPWAPPAVSYGVQSGGSYYPNPLGSSCQLGMSNPSTHFTGTAQPPFHHNVPFAHPNFSPHPNFHASATGVQSSMTPSFYHPPSHIPPSLPSFPSFSQLPANTGSHPSYAAAHAPMYPGSFYSSFRAPYEPQIYHVQLSSPREPFSGPDRIFPDCSSLWETHLTDKPKTPGSSKNDKCRDDSEVYSEKRVQKRQLAPDVWLKNSCDVKELGDSCVHPNKEQSSLKAALVRTGKESGVTALSSDIDRDLLQQLQQASGRQLCDSIDCDDFNMCVRYDECRDQEDEANRDTVIKSLDVQELNSHVHTKQCQRNDTHRFKEDVCRAVNIRFKLKTFQKCRSKSQIFRMKNPQKCRSKGDRCKMKIFHKSRSKFERLATKIPLKCRSNTNKFRIKTPQKFKSNVDRFELEALQNRRSKVDCSKQMFPCSNHTSLNSIPPPSTPVIDTNNNMHVPLLCHRKALLVHSAHSLGIFCEDCKSHNARLCHKGKDSQRNENVEECCDHQEHDEATEEENNVSVTDCVARLTVSKSEEGGDKCSMSATFTSHSAFCETFNHDEEKEDLSDSNPVSESETQLTEDTEVDEEEK